MAIKAVILAAYAFTFLTGLPSNILAFYAFLRKVCQKPSSIDIFLLNLTVSDLILLLFLPLKMVEAASGMIWVLPAFLCPLTNFCFYSSIYLSILFLTAVSVERYLCVAHPIKYKTYSRAAYPVVVSVIFWLLAYSHCSIIYIVEYHNKTLLKFDNSTCYENFSPTQLRIVLPFRLELALVFFCLPFAITLFCYTSVIRNLTSMPNVKAQKKQRAIGLAVVTLLNFAICFGPFNVSHIMGFIQNWSPTWRVYAFLFSSFNTSLDPVIFYFSSATIRQTFADCWIYISSRFPAVVSQCSLWCCKAHHGKDNKGEASQSLGSTLPAGLTLADTPTIAEGKFSLTPKVSKIRGVSTPEIARCQQQPNRAGPGL